MAEVKYNTRGNNENFEALDTELEDFKVMEIRLNDMVSNKFFEHGILRYKDRVLLRHLQQEIRDFIHVLETTSKKESALSRTRLAKRKADIRSRYHEVVHAFENKTSIAGDFKEEVLHKSSSSLHSIPFVGENDAYNISNRGKQSKWEINHGYDDDDKSSDRKEIQGNSFLENRSHHSNSVEDYGIRGSSRTFESADVGLRRSDNHIKIDNYDSMKYFVDDKEETKTLTVIGEENWVFRNPNGTEITLDHLKNNTDKIENVEKGDGQTLTSGHLLSNKRESYDGGDGNIHDDEVKDALGGFDYLDQLDKNNDEVDVVAALSSFSYLDNADEIHEDSIKDALSKFDYLENIDEHNSKKSSAEPRNISEDVSHANGHTKTSYNFDSKLNEADIHTHEERTRQTSTLLHETSQNISNSNKRIFDEDNLEFQNHSIHHITETIENEEFERPPFRDEYRSFKHPSRNVDKHDEVQMVPKIYRSNFDDRNGERPAGLVERTKSQEVVASYTAGEFILRRTRSEDIHHPNTVVRNNVMRNLETVPEDRPSFSTESIDSKEKDSDRVQCNICSLVLKGALLLLFGVGATEITLGIVFRDTCQVEEVVSVCVIASGVVSLFYCITFLGINIVRKRLAKLSRSFRAFLVFLWVILLGLIIAGCVLLYPSIRDYGFKDCSSDEACCSRKLTLVAFCAIIIDLICQFCFIIILCCVK